MHAKQACPSARPQEEGASVPCTGQAPGSGRAASATPVLCLAWPGWAFLVLGAVQGLWSQELLPGGPRAPQGDVELGREGSPGQGHTD